MIIKPRNFQNKWLKSFPFPIIIINDFLRIVLANNASFQKFHIDHDIEIFLDKYLTLKSKSSISTMIEQSINKEYVEKNIEFQHLGEKTVIINSIDNKQFRYYCLLILPSSYKEKYSNLKQKYDFILEHVSDSIIVTDDEQKIIEANSAFSSITGYETEEVLGRFPTILSSGKHDNDFYKNMFIEMHNRGYYKGILTDRKKSGELLNVQATIIPLKDSYDDVKNYIGILKDITEVTKLKADTASTKHKDPLTGVQSRESILHVLDIKAELSTAKNQIAVMFIDLNKFKLVNDTYGHQYGDFVLSSAANRMKKALRANDLIGRYGGDEFIIMLERITKSSAYDVAKKIQETLSKPYVVDEQIIDFISGSIGIAFAPFDSKKAAELIEKADVAMYQAKKSLSTEGIMLSEKTEEKATNNKTLKTELLQAIENDEFYLRIQPIVSTKTQKIVGGEILARWLNLNFNEVYPSTFIPLIQVLGMSKKFDINILNKTISLLEEQDLIGNDFFIDVNFSAEQFSDSKFITMLEDLLEVKPWIANYIVIEITESAMMIDMERTTEHLSAIRTLGFKIAIDDFGTGFSSLSYLKHFSIDYLKIDKSFVNHIENSTKDVAILKSIIALANAISAQVIVEGIEREAQYEIVKDLGADYIQGFYFHKPILPDNYFQKLLKQS